MLSVVKIGGSVFRDDESYARVARFLGARLEQRTTERLVVIVSAQYGATDKLLAEATDISAADQHGSRLATDQHGSTLATDQHGSRLATDQHGSTLAADQHGSRLATDQHGSRLATDRHGSRLATDRHGSSRQEVLDLLWSTGEIRSVALLALHLQRLGVGVAALNVHQAGLSVADSAAAGIVEVRPLHIRSALGRARVVIVPGFLAVRPGGAIASLGRGGSDLTAVLLAAALGAEACELVKDVPGYFTADPHVYADAVPVHELTIDAALEMASTGCDLVQPAALAAARRADLTLVVRSVAASAPVTFLFPRSTAHGVRHEDDSRRTAIGA
jgi:aspartate kinase